MSKFSSFRTTNDLRSKYCKWYPKISFTRNFLTSPFSALQIRTCGECRHDDDITPNLSDSPSTIVICAYYISHSHVTRQVSRQRISPPKVAVISQAVCQLSHYPTSSATPARPKPLRLIGGGILLPAGGTGGGTRWRRERQQP